MVGKRMALYRKLEKTKQWVENNYYHKSIHEEHQGLVQNNLFWVDYAANKTQRFISKHFAQCSNNLTEMMLAMAVMDLPMHSPKHKITLAKTKVKIVASNEFMILHQRLKKAPLVEGKMPILVSQNIFMVGDRYTFDGKLRLDKFVTDEFLSQKVYGVQVVVTNPTSTPREIDVMYQIPQGAIPVQKGKYLESSHLLLQPYNTQNMTYYFYFPDTGEFSMYGVQVAGDHKIIAFNKTRDLHVVKKLSKIDTTSWDYVSQHGSENQVIAYIQKHNLFRINLDRIAFRLKNKAFFNRVIKTLKGRQHYHATTWSYSLKHNQPREIKQFLESRSDFVNRCGRVLSAEILEINPVERKTYQHIDFHPLVNSRIHRLGQRRKIVNETLHRQYQSLLDILSYKNKMSDEDRLSVVYYLLLQDRTQEALAWFKKVDRDGIVTRLQYDYCKAYLGFFTGDLKYAREMVSQYRDYPVDRWQKMFAAMHEQIKEIDGKTSVVIDATDREQTQAELAKRSESADLSIESGKITVSYRNAKRFKVNYYLMDIELLFSKHPFVREFSSEFSMIKPNQTVAYRLDKKSGQMTFPIPEGLNNKNVLVEVELGGQRYTKPYFANQMVVHVMQNFGQIQVSRKGSLKPVARAYVKVYYKGRRGTFFYKDGYTDLRGRFDYASLNTGAVNDASEFSVLVLSEKFGAVIKEAKPPKK